MVSYKSKLIKVTKKEIADVYLKKTNKIQGITVIPIDNKSNYAEFCKNIIKKTPKQLRAYWAREIFRGNKLPPKRLNNTQIKKALKKNSKVISYASNKLTGKIILIISK
jgi:hypothetical protein